MSDFKYVLSFLESKSDLLVVYATFIRNFLPGKNGYWSETVSIIVYPLEGLYEADALNNFMMSLVPEGMEPDSVDKFWDENRSLRFGRLYFDEVIGKKTSEYTITDKDLLSHQISKDKGFIDGKLIIEEDLKRRTWVMPYPDKVITELIYPPKGVTVEDPNWSVSEHRIDKNALESLLKSYKPSLIERAKSLIGM